MPLVPQQRQITHLNTRIDDLTDKLAKAVGRIIELEELTKHLKSLRPVEIPFEMRYQRNKGMLDE